jgi:hemerythrin-like metal-binding protein
MRSDGKSGLVGVGYGKIDEEHLDLSRLIDRMEAALKDEGAEPEFRRLLERFIQDVSVHFLSEQRLMRAHSYPDLDGHTRDHERLLDDLRRIQEGCAAGEEAPAGATVERLRAWLGDHVEGQDVPLGRFLQGQASPL